MSREQVVEIQRTRMLRAMAEAMAEQGYVATTVADVLSRAGVSRETFYQQFASKRDCFQAAYEVAADRVLGILRQETRREGTELERFGRAITAYLEELSREPAFARLFMIEVYSAGQEVLTQRAEVQRRFTQLVADGLGARSRAERFACEALVAAVTMLVTSRLAAGDVKGLRALRRPLIDLVGQALVRLRET